MPAHTNDIFLKFGLSLVLCVLVGIQREYVRHRDNKKIAAGVRTFALMGLTGCVAAMVTETLGSVWPFVVIFFVAGIFVSLSYFIQASHGDTGLTTEFSILLTMLSGALVYYDHIALAIASIVAVTGILSLKIELHKFVQTLSQQDIFATLKFAVITAIILPVLPNQNYGPEPFHIFNPYKIWLLVVLISAISFVGYILIKIIGAQRGIGLMGVLGGLASSTAVTLTMTQRSRSSPELSPSFAQAILLSWTIMYARLFIIVAAVNPALVGELWPPVLGGVFAGLAYCLVLYLKERSNPENEQIAFVNPFELGPAIKFGLLFSVILLISKAAQVYLGNTGIYLASLVSGLADVDAISLSIAEMSQRGQGLSLASAANAIIIASIANTLLKGSVATVSGAKELRRVLAPGTVLIIATVGLLILLS